MSWEVWDMNLRTSFFNKSIFKTDIKRYWWTALLEAFVIFISTVMPIYNRCVNYIEYNGIGYSYGRFSPDWLYHGGLIFLIAFAVGIPVMLFSYMHFSASMSMHHSLPIKRSQLLLTKTLTGLILTIVPILINGAILGAIITAPQFRELIGVMPVVKWCLSGILYTVVIFALTVAVNMMTGHPVGTLIFTAGFAALPSILIVFLEAFFSVEYFGYSGSNMADILKYIYPHEEWLMTFPSYLIYILMGVAFLIGAYFLYNRRKLENHGEVIAFSWLKPVFIGIVAMLSSMLSWAYFNGILSLSGVWWIIPLGVIGTVIAWMVSRKSLSLKGVHKPVLIYMAVALVAGMAVHFDITGFETRVPDVDDILSVQFGYHDDYEGVTYFGESEIKYKLRGGIDTSFKEYEDIKNVTELHKALVKDKTKPYSGYFMPLEYTLKNGKTITRNYHIDYNKLAEYLKPIYETPQMRAVEYDLVDGTEKEFLSIEIQDRRFATTDDDTIYPDNPYMERIIEALKKDIENLTYEDMTVSEGASLTVGVNYNHIADYETPVPDDVKPLNDRSTWVNINKSFVNTRAILEEMGIYDRIPKAKDIDRIEIHTWTGNDYPASDKDYETIATITDRNEIADIYNEYDRMIEIRKYTNIDTAKNIRITFNLKSGHFFEASCSYDEDKIPEVLKKYFE